MKVVILAGGVGSRISEESHLRPKPMIEIGGKPILWHIMKIYASYGLTEFVICCGYKGSMIKEYFANYLLHNCDVTFHMQDNSMEVHRNKVEPWSVTLVDTGPNTLTGGRLKRIQSYVDQEDFCMTYGDGVANVSIDKILALHRREGTWATVTGVLAPARFGSLSYHQNRITYFAEKPAGDGRFINGGFFVLKPAVFEFIRGDETAWEGQPMQTLAMRNQLAVYFHKDFWHPMDTLRDKNYLEELWSNGKAPWKTWNE